MQAARDADHTEKKVYLNLMSVFPFSYSILEHYKCENKQRAWVANSAAYFIIV